jgi:hypothetical protein
MSDFRRVEASMSESSEDNMEIISLAADAIDELDRVIDELGDEEVLALLRLAKRIRDGQLRYGTLNLRYDTRDWHAERQAELDDADIYTAYEDTAEELKARFKTDPAPAPGQRWGISERSEPGWWLTEAGSEDVPLLFSNEATAVGYCASLGKDYEVRPYAEGQ